MTRRKSSRRTKCGATMEFSDGYHELMYCQLWPHGDKGFHHWESGNGSFILLWKDENPIGARVQDPQ